MWGIIHNRMWSEFKVCNKIDLKVMARMKVKAGIRLRMAVASVGELYKIPAYPKACTRKLKKKKLMLKPIKPQITNPPIT